MDEEGEKSIGAWSILADIVFMDLTNLGSTEMAFIYRSYTKGGRIAGYNS